MSAELLTEWGRRLSVNIDSHNQAERRFHWLDNVLGSVSLATIVLLGTVAGTTDLTKGWRVWLVVGVTGLGALASVMQTQLRLGSTAVAHQTAARQYAALRRGVEEALLLDEIRMAERIRDLRQQWDLVAGSAPNVPSSVRRRAKKRTVRS